MRLVGDPEAAGWMATLTGAHEEFEWNAGNLTKNRKHGVEPEEIEQLLHHPCVFEGRITEPSHEKPR